MNFKELKKKNTRELEILLKETREKLLDLKFKATSGQLKTVRDIRKNKILIAQISTLLKEQSVLNNK